MAMAWNMDMIGRKRIIGTFMILCVAMVVFYALNLYKIVANTVAVGKNEKDMIAMNKAVIDLDSKYTQMSNAITQDSVQSHGLARIPVSRYISRTSKIGRLTLGVHEL